MIKDNLEHQKRIAILIFAKDEHFVIQKTVRNIMPIIRPIDALIVVADNCSDDTAFLAEQEGALVLTRKMEKPQGKSAALAWFMKNYTAMILKYDFVVILDADTMLPNDFITTLDKQLNPTLKAAQCRLVPIEFENSPLATLIALSETVEQSIFDGIRAIFGYSIRLRGTGMVFEPNFLLSICNKLDTEVEDIVLSLLIAEKGITIVPVKQAVVFDPKPIDKAAASRQRARWFRGQWTAFWKYRSTFFRILLTGPAGWSVLSSLFLKPRSIKLFLFLVIGILFYWQTLVASFVLILAAFEILLIFIGIILSPNRILFLKALFHIPGFILMWLKGIILSVRAHPWLRVRETISTTDLYPKDCLSMPTSKNLPSKKMI